MPPSSSLQYANTSLSLLFGRDQCSDVFGSDASDEICSPSQTLCCVRRGQEYPACHQSLGKGWCCIGNNPTDNCYVDQPSVCEEKNSVPCTYLAEGTTEACCPRLTSCVIDTPASKEVVRCNIQYGDLQKAGAGLDDESSSSSASPSSSISSIAAIKSSAIRNSANPSTATAAATGSTAQAASTSRTAGHAAGTALPTPPPSGTNSQSQGTSGLAPTAGPGLIAGAAVGGTLGFVALLVLGYLFLRKLLKLRQQGGGGGGGGRGHPHVPQDAPQLPPYGYHDYSQAAAVTTTTTTVGPPGTYVCPELSADTVVDVLAKLHHQPAELPAAK
ncbi:hypothetical protein L209DRAFT_675829 [Thermothelomyces heterothallicus CBS 203.75]